MPPKRTVRARAGWVLVFLCPSSFMLALAGPGAGAPVFMAAMSQGEQPPAGPQLSPSPRTIALQPGSGAYPLGAIFMVDIRASVGSQPVDAGQVVIQFDPAYLRVVDGAGSPVASIIPDTIFSSVTLNSADNADGRIIFAASNPGGATVIGSFPVGRIRFRARATTPGTAVFFITSGAPATRLTLGGADVLDTVFNAVYRLGDVPPLSRHLYAPVTVAVR